MSPLLLYVVKNEEEYPSGFLKSVLIFEPIRNCSVSWLTRGNVFGALCWEQKSSCSTVKEEMLKLGRNPQASVFRLYSVCLPVCSDGFLCYFHGSASLSSDCREHVNQALCISLYHTWAMGRGDFKDAAGIITPIFHFEYFMASYFNKRCSCGWYLLKTDNLAF